MSKKKHPFESSVAPVDPAQCDHANEYFMRNGNTAGHGFHVTVCPSCGRLAVTIWDRFPGSEKERIDIFMPALAHLRAIAQHSRWLDGQGRSYDVPVEKIGSVMDSYAAAVEELEDGGD